MRITAAVGRSEKPVASLIGLGYTGDMQQFGHVGRSGTNCRRRRQEAGGRMAFSLIELLVVLALLIIMMTMYWGFGARNYQRQQQKACQKNLLKIYLALEIYANEHAGKFPEAAGARTSEDALSPLVPRYTADTASFVCPGSKDAPIPSGESFANRKISYAYYMGRRAADSQAALMSDKQVDTQAKAVGQVLFSTNGKAPANNHHRYGGNVLFCDGRAELSLARSEFSLGLTQGVVLLNPRP